MTEPAGRKAQCGEMTLAAIVARLRTIRDLTQPEVDKLLATLKRERQDARHKPEN